MGIQRELRKIEGEYEQNERMKRKIQMDEEEMQRGEVLHMSYNKNQSVYWSRDGRLQFLLQEQQGIWQDMQRRRLKFMEEITEKIKKRRQELTEQEEDCYLRMRKCDEEEDHSWGE